MRYNATSRLMFELHDRGTIKLPAEVIAARENHDRAMNMEVPTFAPPKAYKGGRLDAMIVEAIENKATFDLDRAASEYARQHSASQLAGVAIAQARADLAEAVDHVVCRAAERILVYSLRPMHDQVVVRLKTEIAASDGKGPRLDQLVKQYAEITKAAASLRRVLAQPEYSEGIHAWIRNPHQAFEWGQVGGGFSGWKIPVGIVAQIIAGGEPWLPTAEEEDEAYLADSPKVAAAVRGRAEQSVNRAQARAAREAEVSDLTPRGLALG